MHGIRGLWVVGTFAVVLLGAVAGTAFGADCPNDCDGEYRCVDGKCMRWTCNHDKGQCDWQPAVGCPETCD